MAGVGSGCSGGGDTNGDGFDDIVIGAFWADPDKPCDGCPTVRAFKTMRSEHTTVITPDGRIWDEKGEPVFDANGKLMGVVEIAHDVTNRKRAEEALRESEAKYRCLTNNASDLIWTVDLNMRTTFVNPAVEKVLGFTPEERMAQ